MLLHKPLKLKLLLSYLLVGCFFTSSFSQEIDLKSGNLVLPNVEVSGSLFNGETTSYDNTFYGIIKAKDEAISNGHKVISWLNADYALILSPLESLNDDKYDYYWLPSAFKVDPFLLASINTEDRIRLIINLYDFNTKIEAELLEFGSLKEYDTLNHSLEILTASQSITPLAELPFVFWIELPAPELETNNLRERTNHRVPLLTNFSSAHKLTGKGVVMGEWDGGGAADHIDYDFRHTRIEAFINNNNGRHATHVAGTMLGAGIKDPVAKGMAPEATFYSYNFAGNIPAEMDDASSRYGIEFTQNSYSYGSDPCSRRGSYDNTSVALDRLVNKYPNLLHVFAAGNSRRSNCNPGGYGTVHSGFQASKNSIDVAAVTYLDGNSSFHCYGPLRDGRLKPEISAVGVSVNSTFPNNAYQGGYSGTSMACPGTSGTAALITQLYKEKYNKKPDAHLIKGALCNGADELGRSGPDYQYGFGRLNGYNAATVIDDENFNLDSVNQNGTVSDTIFIDNPHLFKIMLCYNDVEGSSSSSTALVNDLDLTIRDDAGNTLLPWVLNPNSPTTVATRGQDDLNNIEQITVDVPTSKYYVYTVTGDNINSGYQTFSVNWLEQDTSLRIVYPNGGEKWLPPSNSNRSQTIRWDAYGISGNGTLSYSIDSGVTWTAISSVNLNRGYYQWQNCPSSVVTSQALIKIEKGNLSDVSNAVFDIFQTGPTVASVTPCSEQLYITWNAITNAAGYNVYMNVDGKMENLGYTEERNFTIRNLNNSKSYWIALSAVAANGAEGPRSIAQEYSPDANTIPPRFPTSPNSRNACSGSNVFFLSTVNGQNITKQNWQVSTDEGQTWLDIPGATGSLYTVNNIKVKDDGNLYRYTAQNNCLSLETSNWAYLKVDTALPFSYLDTSIDLCVGQSTKLQLLQEGNNENTMDWHFTSADSTTSLVSANIGSILSLNEVGSHQSGKYHAVVKNSCGSQLNSKRISVNISDTLRLSFFGEERICQGQPAINQAIATGGRPENYDFFWKFGNQLIKSAFLTRALDTAETWVAGVYDNCSEDTVYEQRNFVFRTRPQIEISEDTIICKGTTREITLSIEEGEKDYYGYVWKNTTTNQTFDLNQPTISVNPDITTSYTVLFIDSCSQTIDSASTTVTVLDGLKVQILSTKDTLCTNEVHTLQLIGSGGIPNQYKFQWDDGSISNSRIINTDQDTTYSVTITDNCSVQEGKDSIQLNVRPPLEVQIIGTDTLCKGENFVYSALPTGGRSANYSFNWSTSSSSNVTIQGNLDTLLTLELNDGCTPQSANTSKNIEVRQALSLTSDNSNITACHGEQITISVRPTGGKSDDYKITWGETQEGSANQDHQFYTDTLLEVSLSDGCTVLEADLTFNISILPPLSIIASPDVRTCKYSQETLNIQGQGGLASAYQYFIDEVSIIGNSFNQTYTDSTLHIIRLTDNCSETDALDSFWIDVRPINPLIFAVEQENLLVKAKTRSDVSQNFWGQDVNSLIAYADTAAAILYNNYGPVELCLQKIDDFGCRDTNCIRLSLFDVFNTSSFEIDLYPNPTNGEVFLSLDKVAGEIMIDLISSEGKSIWEEAYSTYDQTEFEFNLSDLAPGIYFFDIDANGENIYKKILVE
jgi:hypothetical protein